MAAVCCGSTSLILAPTRRIVSPASPQLCPDLSRGPTPTHYRAAARFSFSSLMISITRRAPVRLFAQVWERLRLVSLALWQWVGAVTAGLAWLASLSMSLRARRAPHGRELWTDPLARPAGAT